MKVFKKIAMGITIMALLASLALASVGCGKKDTDLAGVTDTTIYVGNTAATTGAMAVVGDPFNVGIKAALADYNAKGGYKGLDEKGVQLETGLKVELKHYDDGGDATKASSYMDKLINEDEIFAVVGNFGAYAVSANLDIIKDAGAPMVYAAAGNDELLNENATGDDRGIFPVQPLNKTEGRMLIQRAFAAPNWDSKFTSNSGGLGATKVGVITDTTNEASNALTAGIKAEAENLTAAQKAAIVYQSANTADFSGVATAIKNENCSVIIITCTGANFVNALTALANVDSKVPVLTSYNNASAAVFNDDKSQMTETGLTIFGKMVIYAQGWLDISSTTYVYGKADDEATANTPLNLAYKALGEYLNSIAPEPDPDYVYTGTANFNEVYWDVAESLFNYCVANDRAADALTMSYNSYALAGYIAGDLFCQGLEALKAEGKALTQANYIDAMENKESFNIVMGDTISFQNGMRAGVDAFACSMFFDLFAYNGGTSHSASSVTVSPLTSLEDFRALIAG